MERCPTCQPWHNKVTGRTYVRLSDNFDIKELHRRLDEFAWKYCPVYKDLGLRYELVTLDIL